MSGQRQAGKAALKTIGKAEPEDTDSRVHSCICKTEAEWKRKAAGEPREASQRAQQDQLLVVGREAGQIYQIRQHERRFCDGDPC